MTIMYDFKNTLVIQFYLKGHVRTTKVRNKTFRSGQNLEDKALRVLPPSKVWREFFLKKLCMWKQTLLCKFVGDLFGESSTNGFSFEFSSNLKHCKSGNFHRPWWETHKKIYLFQSIELWKDLSLRLRVESFKG